MEDGLSSKDVMKMHIELEKTHAKLQTKHDKAVADYKAELKELSTKYYTVFEQLTKQ